MLLVDQAYDANALHRQLAVQMVIPSKSNCRNQCRFDRALYRYRYLTENAFNRLKEWRGIATRYAKRLDSFKAAVEIGCLFSVA